MFFFMFFFFLSVQLTRHCPLQVVGMQHYLDALYSRNRNTGLITGVLASLLPLFGASPFLP